MAVQLAFLESQRVLVTHRSISMRILASLAAPWRRCSALTRQAWQASPMPLARIELPTRLKIQSSRCRRPNWPNVAAESPWPPLQRLNISASADGEDDPSTFVSLALTCTEISELCARRSGLALPGYLYLADPPATCFTPERKLLLVFRNPLLTMNARLV